MASGVVATELYSDQSGANKTAIVDAPPPSAPSPVPAVVTQPVPVKPRMADENPDGSVRDTSVDALRPSNDLGFRNLSDEDMAKPPQEAPKPEAAAPAPAPAAPPEPPKETLYAGKFKSPEDLEKAYAEAEKRMNQAMQEAADLRKKSAPTAPVQTPEQKAQESQKLLEKFVQDPQSVLRDYVDRAQQTTMLALDAQKKTEDWRKANPDLAAHEYFVAAEAYRLSQSEPELTREPDRLLQQATDNFRKVFGSIRAEGAKEALATESRVTPLLSNTAPSPATEQPAKAPLTSDDAFALHLKMLKEEESRSHRGLRR